MTATPYHRLRNITHDILAPIWASEISTKRIATTLGVSRQSLNAKAKRLGLPARKRNLASINADEFALMWIAGTPVSVIARHYGVHRQTAKHRAHMLGLAPRAWPVVNIERNTT